MAPLKDTYHFATDYLSPQNHYASRENYLSLFSKAGDEAIVGEASVLYITSKVAAANIHAFEPNARLMVLLRNPVDVIASYHSQMLSVGVQSIKDIRAALEHQEQIRNKGQSLLKSTGVRYLPFYRDLVRFSEQLSRFIQVFGRERVHVIRYDDLKRTPTTVYRSALEFLEIDQNFEPGYEVLNAHKEPRSAFVAKGIEWLTPAGHLAARIMPERWLIRAKASLRSLNSVHTEREAMAPEVRKLLQDEFRGEIESLSLLLGQDFSVWLGERTEIPM